MIHVLLNIQLQQIQDNALTLYIFLLAKPNLNGIIWDSVDWLDKPGHIWWITTSALFPTLKTIPEFIFRVKNKWVSSFSVSRFTIIVLSHVGRGWFIFLLPLTWTQIHIIPGGCIGPDVLARISLCYAHTINIIRVNRVLRWTCVKAKGIWCGMLIANSYATYFSVFQAIIAKPRWNTSWSTGWGNDTSSHSLLIKELITQWAYFLVLGHVKKNQWNPGTITTWGIVFKRAVDSLKGTALLDVIVSWTAVLIGLENFFTTRMLRWHLTRLKRRTQFQYLVNLIQW